MPRLEEQYILAPDSFVQPVIFVQFSDRQGKAMCQTNPSRHRRLVFGIDIVKEGGRRFLIQWTLTERRYFIDEAKLGFLIVFIPAFASEGEELVSAISPQGLCQQLNSVVDFVANRVAWVFAISFGVNQDWMFFRSIKGEAALAREIDGLRGI